MEYKLAKSLFYYDNGILRHSGEIRLKGKAGVSVGSRNKAGYLGYSYMGKYHSVHRTIFLILNGYLPEIVDHKNGIKDDNRGENLRGCTQSENCGNQKATIGSSKYKGVSWNKRAMKWQAIITKNGKQRHLGLFSSEHSASLSYEATAILFFGEYARR